jgi:hypothetical protein
MERESASAKVKKKNEESCYPATSPSSANEVDDRVVAGGKARDDRSVSFAEIGEAAHLVDPDAFALALHSGTGKFILNDVASFRRNAWRSLKRSQQLCGVCARAEAGPRCNFAEAAAKLTVLGDS